MNKLIKILLGSLALGLTACQTPVKYDVLEQNQQYKKIPRSGEEDAIPLAFVAANYPETAAKNGIQGYVKFMFDILPDGTPANIKIIDSVPENIFDEEALRAIKRWKFKPKAADGNPVIQTNMRYVIEFALE